MISFVITDLYCDTQTSGPMIHAKLMNAFEKFSSPIEHNPVLFSRVYTITLKYGTQRLKIIKSYDMIHLQKTRNKL